jgi:N-acetylglutamate synthase-like GNAT family acetyltransferase
LIRNKQSAKSVLAPDTSYWIAEDLQDQIIGTIGLEFGTDAALLRSASVLAAWRGQGVGAALVQEALTAASQEGFSRIYLFSTEAGSYWTRFNFYEVPVSEVIEQLPNVPQVREYDMRGWLTTEFAYRRDLNQ